MQTHVATGAQVIDLSSYKLTFDDEFNVRRISQVAGAQAPNGSFWGDVRSGWRFDANSDIGFGSSSFVDAASGYDPFTVEGGALTMMAVPDRTPFGYPGAWESGLITTQGNFSQTYGYFEVRAKLSSQNGAWEAFWLMPERTISNTAAQGHWQELDVVEHYGNLPNGIYSAIHTSDSNLNRNTQKYLQVYSEVSDTENYHTYGMDWNSSTITFFVDGSLAGSQPTPDDMHSPMYLIANLAVQTEPGWNNANEKLTSISASIDYVRAFSNSQGSTAVRQEIPSPPDGKDPGLYGARAAPLAESLTLDAATADVAHLYYAILNRSPDRLGLTDFSTRARQGVPLTALADEILSSPEYQGRSGLLSGAQFVDQIYVGALGRQAESAGLSYWTDRLDHDDSRAAVAVLIGLSPEARDFHS